MEINLPGGGVVRKRRLGFWIEFRLIPCRRIERDWWNRWLYCLSLVGVYKGVHDLLGVQVKVESNPTLSYLS